MIWVLIFFIIITILDSIDIEFNIDGTIWENRKTKQSIYIIELNDTKVKYQYLNDNNIQYMTIGNLLTKFKYNGE